MDLKLKNKKVLITGSSKGIGLSILKAFSKEGSHVIANARNSSVLKKQVVNINNCSVIAGDVSNEDEAKTIIKKCIKKLGGLDIVVCNVGSGKSVSPGKESHEEWLRVMAINLYSTTNIIEAAKNELAKSSGNIVCISSICGSQTINNAPLTYSAAKSALNSYIKGIARPLAQDGIRIYAVEPGNIIFKNSSWQEKLNIDPDGVNNYLRNEVPLRRFGTPEEIANTVMYLSSSNCNFVTGAVWRVDGGQSCN